VTENTLVIVLALATLLIGFGYGGWQLRKARLAKKRGDTSALGGPLPHDRDRSQR
jgi:cytochrome oxidase assembly protein ShyY1